MQSALHLILVALLSSLIACHAGTTTTFLTPEASAQSTGGKTPQQLPPNKLEGHYEGIRLDFHQDFGFGHPVAIDVEPTGTCVYSDPFGTKWPCHWERSSDRITVSFTKGESLPFQLVDDKLAYLKRDGIGGGVCIQLTKNKALWDTGDGLCQGVMMGWSPPLPK